MKFTAAQIAGILEGEVVGNPDAEVFKLSKIEEGTEGSLTFLANPKYINYIYSTQASVTIVNNTFEPEQEITTTLIKVEDAYQSFSKLLEYYNQVKLMKSGIEQPSVISDGVTYGSDLYLGSFCYVGKNVTIGNNVKIYPNSFIGDNVTIGDNCVFFAGVRIYSETVIGNRCTIHSGTIIGSDGFGFAPQEDGSYRFSRTRDCFDDFVDVLSQVDQLLLLEVYSAGEKPIVGADSRSLARSIRLRGEVEPILIDPVEGNLQNVIQKVLQANDLLLTQGAGNVGAISVELAQNQLYLK